MPNNKTNQFTEDDLDIVLSDLVELVKHHTEQAKLQKKLSRDLAEGVCIVLSMAYARCKDGDK